MNLTIYFNLYAGDQKGEQEPGKSCYSIPSKPCLDLMLALGVLIMIMPPASNDALLFHGGNPKQIMSRYSRWWSDQLKQDKRNASNTVQNVPSSVEAESSSNVHFEAIDGVDGEDVALFVNKVTESAFNFDEDENVDQMVEEMGPLADDNVFEDAETNVADNKKMKDMNIGMI